jgi:hypothetical protein
MNWRIKALIQKGISVLPFSHRLNLSAQRLFTVGRELPRELLMSRIEVADTHMSALERFGKISISDARILELGTGWYPIVPIALFLSGANEVHTTDIRKLYTRKSIDQTIRALLKINAEGEFESRLSRLKLDRIGVLNEALNKRNVQSKLSTLSIASNSGEIEKVKFNCEKFDFIVSNNTLEYVPAEKVNGLFRRLSQLCENETILSLSIDLSDEFSYSDPTLHRLNFLKFTSRKWKRITCKLNQTNRLRYSDFKQSFSTYFQLLDEQKICISEQELSKLNIHSDFEKCSKEDLRVTHSHSIMKKK